MNTFLQLAIQNNQEHFVCFFIC